MLANRRIMRVHIHRQLVCWFMLLFIPVLATAQPNKTAAITGNNFRISFPLQPNNLWEYRVLSTGESLKFKGPVFEINGTNASCDFTTITMAKQPLTLKNGVKEFEFTGLYKKYPALALHIIFQVSPNNPVVRFRYKLTGNDRYRLTKKDSTDYIQYFTLNATAAGTLQEVRFSEFNELYHSFCLAERPVSAASFSAGAHLIGPMLNGTIKKNAFLLAYEHGSQVPDKFLQYNLSSTKEITLEAVKGNYVNEFSLANGDSFESIWFQVAAINGNEDKLAASYREFVLQYMSENAESRKPYIFYNTWNYQERNKHWKKKAYLEEMNSNRMLAEIDVAHKMGVDVFVIDAGWFNGSGDWEVNKSRFPDTLHAIKAKLDGYGMKLGLWFNPTIAAKSSKMLENNRDCMKRFNGKEEGPFPVWETEESYGMCLVSRYRDAFADQLIYLAKELGVRYFKWDAIAQYGCNSPNHFHGTEKNSAAERADAYAFEIGRSMSYVVNKLCAAQPEAIVDFDITEGERAVGLGFLSAGKYFLINNGPYYQNYNVPIDPNKDNWNIFFYPGPARSWICRAPLSYDKWIPSVLFLTHYLPDDPYDNQSISVASLILGQNGIWGDLLSISPQGVQFFGEALAKYKEVRDDITQSTLVKDGAVGGSPEVYEKVNTANGRGAITLFSSHKGVYQYITKCRPNQKFWATKGVDIAFTKQGYAVITANFDKAEAKILFFGVQSN